MIIQCGRKCLRRMMSRRALMESSTKLSWNAISNQWGLYPRRMVGNQSPVTTTAGNNYKYHINYDYYNHTNISATTPTTQQLQRQRQLLLPQQQQQTLSHTTHATKLTHVMHRSLDGLGFLGTTAMGAPINRMVTAESAMAMATMAASARTITHCVQNEPNQNNSVWWWI